MDPVNSYRSYVLARTLIAAVAIASILPFTFKKKKVKDNSSSELDPDFTYFRSAKRYTTKPTDHDSKFLAFRGYLLQKTAPLSSSSPYVIQFVCHPNFEQQRKVISYFIFNKKEGTFDRMETLPEGFVRANAYHNYMTNLGHPRGLYYELNLYTPDGQSNHHTSRVKGINFLRDDSHDFKHGTTKGRHWRVK